MQTDENHRTILVVEDQALIRLEIVATLELTGFRVLEASSSADALTILAHHPEISVLVTGVCMPGEMDGLALVRQVSQDRPSISSIVVSGNVFAKRAHEVVATEFIATPFMPRTLIGAVHKAIRRQELRQKRLYTPDASV